MTPLESARGSLQPATYGALQTYPGLQAGIFAPATLVYRHGEVGDHFKA